MSLNLTPEHIAYKKRVGKMKDNDVWEIATTGGLYINLVAKNGGFEIMSTGPHRAVSRHIAEQRFNSIVWTELSKADHVDYADYAYLLPKYEKLTDQLREAHAQRKQ